MIYHDIKQLISISLISLVLTACGFTPVHAPLGGTQANFQNIKVETQSSGSLQDQEGGFYLEQRLKDRIGVNGMKYILRVEPRVQKIDLGISSRDVASRYDYSIQTSFVLLDPKTGKTLTRGSVKSLSTFAAPADPYGQVSSEKNALQLVSKDNADRILAKLAGYFSKLKSS